MTGTIPATGAPRIFRGWWVLAGIFITMTTGSGFAFYAQGVFLDALVEEQGFTVGMAGAGTGFFFVVSGVAGYYAGGLISRFDIRAVMVAGSTVASVGILLLGQVRTLWQMFAVFFVYGGGYALAGLVPATSLVTRWFHVRRSIALSIASTGLSVGGILITPVIAQLIDGASLVDLAPTLAVAYWLGMVPVTLLLLRPSPEALGLRPDGVADAEAEGGDGDGAGSTEPSGPTGMLFADAVRTRYFRLVSFAFILVMGAQVGAIQHVFKLTKDAVDVDAASLALVVITSTSVAARLAGGVAATRFSLTRLISVLVVVQAVGISVIGLANQQTTILLGVVILGLAMGNLLMLHPLLLAEAFGIRDYPRIYGLGSLMMVTGVGLGPFIVGLIRDAADYGSAFFVMAGTALGGLVIFRLAGPSPAAERVPAATATAPRADDAPASSAAGAEPALPVVASVTPATSPEPVGVGDPDLVLMTEAPPPDEDATLRLEINWPPPRPHHRPAATPANGATPPSVLPLDPATAPPTAPPEPAPPDPASPLTPPLPPPPAASPPVPPTPVASPPLPPTPDLPTPDLATPDLPTPVVATTSDLPTPDASTTPDLPTPDASTTPDLPAPVVSTTPDVPTPAASPPVPSSHRAAAISPEMSPRPGSPPVPPGPAAAPPPSSPAQAGSSPTSSLSGEPPAADSVHTATAASPSPGPAGRRPPSVVTDAEPLTPAPDGPLPPSRPRAPGTVAPEHASSLEEPITPGAPPPDPPQPPRRPEPVARPSVGPSSSAPATPGDRPPVAPGPAPLVGPPPASGAPVRSAPGPAPSVGSSSASGAPVPADAPPAAPAAAPSARPPSSPGAASSDSPASGSAGDAGGGAAAAPSDSLPTSQDGAPPTGERPVAARAGTPDGREGGKAASPALPRVPPSVLPPRSLGFGAGEEERVEPPATDADPVGEPMRALADEVETEREARSKLVGASIVVGSAAMAGALVVWRLTGRGGRGA